MVSQIFQEENERYKKRKGSSVSKAKVKAKHKHTYEDCLLFENGKPNKATYCSICGKIDDVKVFDFVRISGGYRVLSEDEVLEKYKDLKKFEVESVFQKCIPKEELSK